jgi:WhiB family redox-sensing transcriptional regulator
MPPEQLALVMVILADTPRLPGAACRGLAPAFDAPGRDGDPTLPLAVCRHCPAVTACKAWLDQLEPSARPTGVVAGQVIESPHDPVWQRRRRRPGRRPA